MVSRIIGVSTSSSNRCSSVKGSLCISEKLCVCPRSVSLLSRVCPSVSVRVSVSSEKSVRSVACTLSIDTCSPYPRSVVNRSLSEGLVYNGVLSPPCEPKRGGYKLYINLPNGKQYSRLFNSRDRIGDLLNYIRMISDGDNLNIANLNFRNRTGSIACLNNSICEVGLLDGSVIELQRSS